MRPVENPGHNPWSHFKNGRFFGYPLCCVLRYVVGVTVREKQQAVKRGVVRLSSYNCYVPCRIFHKGEDFYG